ncbi:NAD(P)/FAD-dependent oxidoreductase [Chitinispirillales bacterium ANBcel5]|uniref:NAD(P)/FAD-dependent oxidoreductase n=1 Tax=Cellulosispirillum alkaliphilum TaxID=3039283 RepID=UPI002A56B9BC|nr:NAD(P)/FAD-dependent oxidoreductase [Chitinispirillales bacterium ANBcel5]
MKFDTVIVGAGLAGLYMGSKLSGAGQRVCIVDRRALIGEPVRCGEATGNRAELSRFLSIDEDWIACNIQGLSMHLNGTGVAKRAVRDAGVVLHRDRLERSLAKKAVASGAQLRLNTTVTGLLPGNSSAWSGVVLESGEIITADVIVGADGPESRVGQWAGLTKSLSLNEVASAVEYRVESDFCNDGYLHFFTGSQHIDSGYIWVFPKEDKTILVGAALYHPKAGSPRAQHYLHYFMEKYLPGAKKQQLITGSIPICVSPVKLANKNVLIIGDAARQCNPLTAGGIMNALEAADYAVESIKNFPKKGQKAFKVYSQKWRKNQRRQQKLFLLLREIMVNSTDTQLSAMYQKISHLSNSFKHRVKPFTIPLIPLFSFLVAVAPKFLKHRKCLRG